MKKYLYKGKVISRRQANWVMAKCVGKIGLGVTLMYVFIIEMAALG